MMKTKKKPVAIIAKFGGTSVASRDAVLSIVAITKRLLPRKPVLVVSAVSGVTEMLLALSRAESKDVGKHIKELRKKHAGLVRDIFPGKTMRSKIMGYIDERLEQAEKIALREEHTPQAMDELASFGEIISSHIISRALRAHGVDSEQVVSTRIIATDGNFTQADFMPRETKARAKNTLQPIIKRGIVPVVTGFLGATKDGRITTLGRGGSDYSASIIGYALDADEIQIWTDVNGIYTADPRVVKTAGLIEEISYREASEMASFGAKVLHPRTIRPAVEKNIPVRVLNTFNPSGGGTLISPHAVGAGLKAIAFKRRVVLITIYSTNMLFTRGFLAKVFDIFARENISVDLVSVSEVSVSVTLDNPGHLNNAVSALEKFSKVTVDKEGFGVVSLIGEEIASTRHLLKDVIALSSKNKIALRMISMGASDINVSLVMKTDDIERTVNLVHDEVLLKGSPLRGNVAKKHRKRYESR